MPSHNDYGRQSDGRTPAGASSERSPGTNSTGSSNGRVPPIPPTTPLPPALLEPSGSTPTYALAESSKVDAPVSFQIHIAGGTLASFARSRSPGKLSRADLKAMALELFAECCDIGKAREAASVLKTLADLVPETTGPKTVDLDLVQKAMQRIERARGKVHDAEPTEPTTEGEA